MRLKKKKKKTSTTFPTNPVDIEHNCTITSPKTLDEYLQPDADAATDYITYLCDSCYHSPDPCDWIINEEDL